MRKQLTVELKKKKKNTIVVYGLSYSGIIVEFIRVLHLPPTF